MADFEVKLSEIPLATRKIRFLHMKTENEVRFEEVLSGKYMPLFLGADVLAECSISVPNLPRTHAKFAKRGFASKINFPSSTRVFGIHGTARGVWFYNIQGLFRVAFEYYDREDQLQLLNCLQHVWKLRFADPLLKEAIHPTCFESWHESFDINVKEKRRHSKEKGKITFSINNAHSDAAEELCQANNASLTQAKTKSDTKETTNIDVQHDQQFLQQEVQEESLVISSGSNASLSEQCLELCNKFGKESHECEAVIMTLISMLREYVTQPLQESNEKQKLLCELCHWLGKEFRDSKDDIEERVTEFKTRHIATIDSLPPAEAVIQELFPPCMRVLLRTWMGRDDDDGTSGFPAPPWPLFPLMQLILEFANQTLVSGVAHVLYSRLLRADSV